MADAEIGRLTEDIARGKAPPPQELLDLMQFQPTGQGGHDHAGHDR